MRNKLIYIAAFFTLLLATGSCSKPDTADVPMPTESLSPTDTVAPTSTPTVTPAPTQTTAPTNTPVPTSEITFAPEITVTLPPSVTDTPTPEPTNTPTPKPTSTPTPTPTNTPTPKPTNTPTPKPTNTPTPTPAPAVPEGFPEISYKENTVLQDTALTSEEEISRYLFQCALEGYYQFGLFAEDLSMLHTEAEYLELFPEFINLEVESLTKYSNGYYLRISDLTTTQVDIAYHYALRTGDTSFLTENEKLAYQKLLTIADELQLKELNDIDAVVAAHDYLILNTVYDEYTANSGCGGVSHYAEGLLLNGLAVCSGYASTFQLLMELAGVDCEYVTNHGHAWNLVKIEDEWYHIDVTWDDPIPDTPDVVIYTHFMMTDAELANLKDHANWSCECNETHECDDESYRLYPYKDYICTTESEAATLISSQASEKQITLVYPVDGPLSQESLLQLVYDTLAISGSITYYPEEPLGSTHYLLYIEP